MAIADIAEVSVHRAEPKGLRIQRHFTREGVHPYDEVEWELRDSSIPGESGNVFEQKGVEVPKFWSQTATNVVASKYFRGKLGAPERESSVKQMVDRVVDTIARAGFEGGYFLSAADRDAFADELKYLMVHQHEFIWCKAKEEKKAWALGEAGYDMSLNGEAWQSIQFQNANNSVRVTDEFMKKAQTEEDWSLTARIGGTVLETIKARALLSEISEAAWQCGDPGMQFDTTINDWHTTPASGRINGSNPCSEYMSIDDSACNLASLNLLRFVHSDGEFDVERFRAAVEVVFTAQEILVGHSDYPTAKIAENARSHRQLGLGYANLSALLMQRGLPYDSNQR